MKMNAKRMTTNAVLIALYVNSALSVYGTNFMFLARPPLERLPYLNLNRGWHVYFLRVVALGIVLLTLFHLPFILHVRKMRTQSLKSAR